MVTSVWLPLDNIIIIVATKGTFLHKNNSHSFETKSFVSTGRRHNKNQFSLNLILDNYYVARQTVQMRNSTKSNEKTYWYSNSSQPIVLIKKKQFSHGGGINPLDFLYTLLGHILNWRVDFEGSW